MAEINNEDDNNNTTSTGQLPWIITRIISTAWSSHLLLQTKQYCSLEWNVSLALISKSMFKFISTKMLTEVILVERPKFVAPNQEIFVLDYVEALRHITNEYCVIKTPSKLVIEALL
ncbi:hypothetical protein SAMD00019534_014330 [Acytostelium subglobosum LB1]|uniref:hypothetical protein n=1 Tax=Acytostelium subglobosum LB1 TaxID=1410327 RepID=UPI000644BBCE|nr:hypothetical protein SAMD00019534_014330 [Acytostelium subglobosum LB1]GAM18258.1 hypothetical protein SAMD00019534_014330 [Acytostelium subglobosum LB1]|eukprot:XP_012758854.1 hypothetical protein SAMD00019534_014330 [Acytostelium subglobosum LB1]